MPKASRGRRPAPNPKKKTRSAGSGATGYAVASGALRPVQGVESLGVTPAFQPGAAESLQEALRAPVRREPGIARRRNAGTGQMPARRRFADSIGDYWYVGGDLRRIGLMAGGLVGFLIALSLMVH